MNTHRFLTIVTIVVSILFFLSVVFIFLLSRAVVKIQNTVTIVKEDNIRLQRAIEMLQTLPDIRNTGKKIAETKENIFIGSNSGQSTTTGEWNTFLGHHTGMKNTIGELNTYIGAMAGEVSNIGYYNTFIGATAGLRNTTGFENTYIGQGAGYLGETGQNNTLVGTQAGDNNINGSENVFLGSRTGFYNQAHRNTFVGTQSGFFNTSGKENVFIGYRAGRNNTSGSNNVMIGNDVALSDSTISDKLCIGNSNERTPLIYGDFSAPYVNLNGDVTIGGEKNRGNLLIKGAFLQQALSTEPANPPNNHYVVWLSDGKGVGEPGDVMIKVSAGGITKTSVLLDFDTVK